MAQLQQDAHNDWQAGSKATCQATTANGRPCLAPTRTNQRFCVFHDTQTRALMRDARHRGGLARSAQAKPVTIPMDLSTPAGVLEMLTAVGRAVAAGHLDSRRANALTHLGSQTLRALSGQIAEERLARLEAAVGELSEERGDGTQ